jgi:hypothetical protein
VARQEQIVAFVGCTQARRAAEDGEVAALKTMDAFIFKKRHPAVLTVVELERLAMFQRFSMP